MSAPVILVTGTDTEVGKTVATAAIASALMSSGMRVAVIKAAQTGLRPGEAGDVDEVTRLCGHPETLTTHEFVRLPDPLAPDAAARIAQVELPGVNEHAARIAQIADDDGVDTVIVEGSGGLLVHLDGEGRTLADLGMSLLSKGVRAGFILVTAPRLGTLNVTQLTAEALNQRDLDLIGYIIGSYPEQPGLAEKTNLEDLPNCAGAQEIGRLSEGAARLSATEFRNRAVEWVHL